MFIYLCMRLGLMASTLKFTDDYSHPRQSVVVVDDDPLLVEVCTMALEPYYQVRGFINPSQALLFFRKHSADILVTDYTMPGINGLELSRQVKQMHPNIKVMMISGTFNIMIGTPQDSTLDLVDKFLAKPFAAGDLVGGCQTMHC
jgi:DNA-binding NtrC family response regulator